MKAIVAVDANNGIGKNGKLLFKIPEDMAFFKATTMDKVVVMGRKTFESMNNNPLKGRINIVLTSNPDSVKSNNPDRSIISGNSKSFDSYVDTFYQHKFVFIIGGASIYNQYIDKCDEVYITKYNRSYDADTFFPNIEEHGFKLAETITEGVYEGYPYTITKWIKNDILL